MADDRLEFACAARPTPKGDAPRDGLIVSPMFLLRRRVLQEWHRWPRSK